MKFNVSGEDIKEFLLEYGYQWRGYYTCGHKIMTEHGLPTKKYIKAFGRPLRIMAVKDTSYFLLNVYATPTTFIYEEFESGNVDLSSEWKNFLINSYKEKYTLFLIQYYKKTSEKMLKNFENRKQELLLEIKRERNQYKNNLRKMKNEINDCFKNNKIDERV